MNVRVFRSASQAARAAARAVAAQLARKPASVLGLPTGRTALAVYDELVRLHRLGKADFSRAHSFNIDEFLGLKGTDPRSFRAFMHEHLFSRVNLGSRRIHFLDGAATSYTRECDRFEQAVSSVGGLDLLLLGIGRNAHIGFNEPGRFLHAWTHRARLTASTRRANASRFGGVIRHVPREALTMGIGTMLAARSIVLIATGRSKARAVASMLSGRISTARPASMLQAHPRVEIILDSSAAQMLPKPRFRPQA